MVNPYARKPAANQNANSAGVNPYAKSAADSSASSGTMASPADQNSLWVDKHAPQATRDILGNKENIQKLSSCECFCVPCTWCWIANNFRFTHISNFFCSRDKGLDKWERTFLDPKASGKTFSNPKGPWKAALLSGPPGIGSTYWR